MELIIRNGYIIDGTGEKGYYGDIAIENNRIIKVGSLGNMSAEMEIDAGGLVVAPGFIDIHSHSDWRIFSTLQCENTIRQGITTEIVGHCGDSAYPALSKETEEIYDYFKKQPIDTSLIRWKTTEDFWKEVEEIGLSHNVAFLVGHGTLRLNVMGYDNRKLNQQELEKMKKLLREAMEAGALGMSTGLAYAPGIFADKEELIDLSRVVSRYDGVYTSHLRNQSDKLIEAVEEAVGIGKEAKVAVNISHLKAADKENWGKVADAIRIIDKAREDGLDVICDAYPYVAASNPLSAELPSWIIEDGHETYMKNLRDEKIRNRLRNEMPSKEDDFWKLIYVCDVGNADDEKYIGKNLSQISSEENTDPITVVCDILYRSKDNVQVNVVCMKEDDVRYVLSYKNAAVGADGGVFLTEGYSGHPRAFGTFPAYLGRYIRDLNLASLEEGIRKITSLPAEFMGIEDRGIIKEGMFADITIFDYDTIIDKATYGKPNLYCDGIKYVIINGQVQLDDNKYNRVKAGHVIRRGKRNVKRE